MGSFLLYSDAGDLAWLALRLEREGHAAPLVIADPQAQLVGQGMVQKTHHPRTTNATTIVFDATGQGELGSLYRQAGYGVLGGNPLDVALEIDRAKAVQLAESIGMLVPQTKNFPTVAAVIGFLEHTDGEWFFKVSGRDLSCALTYNDKDPKALARFLRWATPLLGDAEGFLLQQKVDGIECDVEGMFDGLHFIPGGFTATLEDKRFGVGGRGPRVGCQSNIVWQLRDDSPLVALTVLKWADVLRQSGYVGPFATNSIWTAQGPFFLECTARFGFDAAQASQGLLLEGNVGNTLAAFARGELAHYPYRADVFAATLRVSTLPFPSETGAEMMRGLPVGPAWVEDPTVFPDDVMLDDREPVLSGRDGNVGAVGLLGVDWPAMQRDLVQKASTMGVPHAQYFVPVARAVRDWHALHGLGFLRDADLPDAPLEWAP